MFEILDFFNDMLFGKSDEETYMKMSMSDEC